MHSHKVGFFGFAAAFLFACVFASAGALAQEYRTDGKYGPKQSSHTGFTVKRIGDGVYAALGTDRNPAESNAGFIIGSDAVAVVDSFEDVGPARDLLAAIRKITSLPIRYVINTHYHLDHVGGNRVFAEQGAVVIAQDNVRAWGRVENLKRFGGKPPTLESRAYYDGFRLPELTYSGAINLYLGTRLVQVRHMPGHTGGDSVVSVPDAGVVFAGDMFWNKSMPNLIDGSTDLWVGTLGKLAEQFPASAFVPGHGPVGTRDDLVAFKDYLLDLRTRVAAAQAAGHEGAGLVELVSKQLAPGYMDWANRARIIPRNVALTDAELRGVKVIPEPIQ